MLLGDWTHSHAIVTWQNRRKFRYLQHNVLSIYTVTFKSQLSIFAWFEEEVIPFEPFFCEGWQYRQTKENEIFSWNGYNVSSERIILKVYEWKQPSSFANFLFTLYSLADYWKAFCHLDALTDLVCCELVVGPGRPGFSRVEIIFKMLTRGGPQSVLPIRPCLCRFYSGHKSHTVHNLSILYLYNGVDSLAEIACLNWQLNNMPG
jgi:hypothetical protein